MKTSLALSVLLSSLSAFAGYDSTWYKEEFWAGEYPSAVVVYDRGVKVPARKGMDPDLKTFRCELPYKAVFSPWNTKRNAASKARYYTAAKIIPLVAKETFTYVSEEHSPMEITKGDTVEYLMYGAEGSFTVRFQGKIYGAHQDLLEKLEGFPGEGQVSHEWLKVRCLDGKTGWIRTDEIQYHRGIWPNPGEAQEEYGKVRDITSKEAADIRRSAGSM